MTKKDVVCPECNEVLEVDECNYEYYGSDTVVGYVDGICPKCRKFYAWKELYKLAEITNLREIEV